MTVPQLLDTATTPDGKRMSLSREGKDLTIYVEEFVLMSSRLHGSEEALAELGCNWLGKVNGARVLVGGLGLGYTLRATLDLVRDDAEVEVVELMPAVVKWHREGPLGELAKHPVDDPRTKVIVSDLGAHLRRAQSPRAWREGKERVSRDERERVEPRYDVMLLDVDNGPRAFASKANEWLYGEAGLTRMKALLKRGGRIVFWSAIDDKAFAQRLARAGFEVRVVHSGMSHRGDKEKHVLFVGSVR